MQQDLWFDASTTVNDGDEPYTNLFLINLQEINLQENIIMREDVGKPYSSSTCNKRLGPERAFDPDHPEGWCSDRIFSSRNIEEWIAYEFSRPVTVRLIAFKGDADPDPLDSPTSYTFEGSNDGGCSWKTLIKEEDTPPFVGPEETRYHQVPNPSEFVSYRLTVTQTAWSKSADLCGSVVVRCFQMY